MLRIVAPLLAALCLYAQNASRTARIPGQTQGVFKNGSRRRKQADLARIPPACPADRPPAGYLSLSACAAQAGGYGSCDDS